MYKKLLDKIIEYKSIVIFRHISPDGDCVFSSLALYNFLKDNFKDKVVKLTGNDKFDLISKNDKVSNKLIEDSLVIVLDTSNVSRIDDERAMNGKYIIKIDHHPITNNYGDINIVNTEAAAACEVLADILLSKSFAKYTISDKVCEYLYCGLITDTINFKTTNTTAHTLLIASKLAEKGKLKIAELVHYTTGKDIVAFEKATKLRQCLKTIGTFGYIKLSSKQLNELGISAKDAKHDIDEIGNIKGLNIWVVSTENEDGKYEMSLRSKRGYVVNETAALYGGGGHVCAAGVKDLGSKQIDEIHKQLIEISTKKPKNA